MRYSNTKNDNLISWPLARNLFKNKKRLKQPALFRSSGLINYPAGFFIRKKKIIMFKVY